eukprot:TRINITY_DN606_c0_g1_i3.p1 TRINITY_DN606_c0_g1~~TRINITY_DN606_c0_g1_i3.p1  ORF type:complete len:116 (+),score=11.68 TRINITY_DN606_c0_g1_i3:117-464(+)
MVHNTRVTYRRRHPYRTASNRTRVVKTPGGKLTVQYVKKRSKGPKCGDCGIALSGIRHLSNPEYKRISRRQKTVNRAYGGVRCSNCVKQRIVRAFLIEEQKIVKRVLKRRSATKK